MALLKTISTVATSKSNRNYAAAVDNDNGDYKTTQDYKDSIKKDVYAKSDKTDQHLVQDNLCYRGNDCEQANEGEYFIGLRVDKPFNPTCESFFISICTN